jgi:hypothetical protein
MERSAEGRAESSEHRGESRELERERERERERAKIIRAQWGEQRSLEESKEHQSTEHRGESREHRAAKRVCLTTGDLPSHAYTEGKSDGEYTATH